MQLSNCGFRKARRLQKAIQKVIMRKKPKSAWVAIFLSLPQKEKARKA